MDIWKICSALDGQAMTLDLTGGQHEPAIIQAPYIEDDNQHWELVNFDSCIYIRSPLYTKRAITISGDDPNSEAARLVLSTYESKPTQHWQVEDAKLDDEGEFVMIASVETGQVMAVASGSTEPNAQLIQFPYSGDNSQEWKLEWVNKGDKICKLVSLLDGQVVSVGGIDPMSNAAPLVQQYYSGSMTQHWKLVSDRDSYAFLSICSNQAIAVASASYDEAAQLIQYPFEEGETSQLWRLLPLNLKKIVSVAGKRQVISVASGSKERGENLIQFPYTNDSSQQWRLMLAGKWSTRVVNVTSAFSNVKDTGTLMQLHASGDAPGSVFSDHIQGMSSYRDLFFVVKNPDVASRYGRIAILRKSDPSHLLAFDTALEGYPHVDGGQVIGHFLAQAVEGEGEGKVYFYNLRTITSAGPEVVIGPTNRPLQITCPGGAGAVGITDVGFGVHRRYVVATVNHELISVYSSNETYLNSGACSFDHVFDKELPEFPEHHEIKGADNLCLLTNLAGQVFMVGFTTDTDGVGWPTTNWARLYAIDLEKKDIVPLVQRQMIAPGVNGEPDPSFRWGAGLRVVSPTQLEFFCCQRNFRNEFDPLDPGHASWHLYIAFFKDVYSTSS